MNIDENTMQNIKNMVDNGNISEAISNISPEMIQNFSKLLSNQQNDNQQQNANQTNNNPYHNNQTNNNHNFNNTNQQNNFNNNINHTQSFSSNENTANTNNNFDFSNIDMNTIMKMTSVLGKMNNNQNDPRANLLNSLKPYLRDNKKGKLDNYMNLLNVSKIAEIMKETNKENNNNV